MSAPPLRWSTAAFVAAGGALGSLARWSLTLAWPAATATLAVNLVGCLAIGALGGLVHPDSPRLRPFLGAGVLGGFTTFSTFALLTRDLLAAGHPGRAASYVVVSVVGGLLAVVAGLLATRALRRPA